MALLQFHSSSNFLCVFITCLIILARPFYVSCLNFSYSSSADIDHHFIFRGSATPSQEALKITEDSLIEEAMKNTAGGVLFRDPLKLWSKKSSKIASFNTSFVMSILSVGNSSLGEGLAFIMTSTPSLPSNRSGRWIGMGIDIDAPAAKFVAVVFDTSWKVGEGNRVGLAKNSIDRSVPYVDLSEYCMNISDGSNYSVSIRYDGRSKDLTVDVHKVNGSRCGSSEPVISKLDLDLSKHLTKDVYVGFSASTSEFYQLNYIYSWSFTSSGTATDRKLLKILLPLALVLLLAFVIASIVFFKIRRRGTQNYGRRSGNSNVESVLVNSTKGPVKFRLKQLKSATTNFDPRHKLGQGGFGEVYKGFLKESQEQIAVKRVSRDSKQGVQEFVSEITTIGKLSHKNLARLIGWCCEKDELLLVYEFLSNGSLDKYLFRGQDNTMAPLSWDRRHKIIQGVASALYYLHDGCPKRVLHRDVKASNVMLDKDYNARLGDFGLARTIQQDGHTHHTTHVLAGTPGYVAPEYCITGQASAESDVYAFGALALEVVTGTRPAGGRRRNPYDNHVIDWVWELYGRQRLVEAGDPNLEGEFDSSQLETLLRLGISCCHPSSTERPTMRVALQVLSGEVPPPEPPREKPSFMWPALTADVDVERDELCTIGGRLSQTADISGR